MPDELLQAIRQYINGEYLMDDYEVTADKLHKYCAQLLVHVAAMTAERDALNTKIARLQDRVAELMSEGDGIHAQLAAVPVQAIDFYFYHTNEELMTDADIPGNPEAMVAASVLIGDWLVGLGDFRR